jgi:cysteinyl-tRNA synthetase
LRAWADLKHQSHADFRDKKQSKVSDHYATALKNIRAAIFDDLNTSVALSELASLANGSMLDGIDRDKIQAMLNIADQLFGLQLGERPTINDTQKQLITERQQARDAKDWAKSDELRDQLKAQGIAVRDTFTGPIWQRI